MKNFFLNNWTIILSFIFLTISIIRFKNGKFKGWLSKANGIYYSVCLIIILFYIKCSSINTVSSKTNSFGVPGNMWVYFITLVGGLFIAIAINFLIISNGDIHEISIGPAKITKDEVEKIEYNIDANGKNVDKLIDSIKAQHTVLDHMESYLTSRLDQWDLNSNPMSIDWCKETSELINRFCNEQNPEFKYKLIKCIECSDNSYEKYLRNNLNLTSKSIQVIRSHMEKLKVTQAKNRNRTKTYEFIPYRYIYSNKSFIVIIDVSDIDYFSAESYIFIDILKAFENCLTYLISSDIKINC